MMRIVQRCVSTEPTNFSNVAIIPAPVLSRVHDNRHHPADVVGGALLGGSVASLVFGIWYVCGSMQRHSNNNSFIVVLDCEHIAMFLN